MKKRTVCTRRSYCVEITVKQFTVIESRDEKCTGMSDFGLLTILERMGVNDIEYNGHFGANIFYTVDADIDTDDLRANIEKAIIDYSKGVK